MSEPTSYVLRSIAKLKPRLRIDPTGTFRQLSRAALLLTVLVITSTACSREQEQAPPRVVTIQLLHTPELRAYLSLMRDAFASTGPTLTDGTRVQVELVPELGVPAASKVASGEIKTDVWLAPSSALINFANSQVRNLGARQIDCQQLFSSPVVLAVPTDQQSSLSSGEQTFDWLHTFKAISKGFSGDSRTVRFSHAPPKASVSGLSAMLQLLAFASDNPLKPAGEVVWSEQGYDALREFEHHVSEYSLSDGFLLERTAQSTPGFAHLILTTEQQVVMFNRNATASRAPVTALYPDHSAVWQDYTLCRSAADWMTPEHLEGTAIFTQFMSSEQAQAALPAQGFRPSILRKASPDLLGPSVGVNLSLPKMSVASQSGTVVREILSRWESLLRPVAITIVIDTSSSMEGDALTGVRDALREFCARIPPHVMVALVAFANEPKLIVPFTADRAQPIAALDSLSAQGGSAAYDGIKYGLDTLSVPERAKDRHILLVITDGEGQTSETSQASLQSSFMARAREQDLSTLIMTIRREGSSYQDLMALAKIADGRYKEVSVGELSAQFEDILKSL